MSVTGSIMAGVGLAGGLGEAAIGANAAGNAAAAQESAAKYSADLQYKASQDALKFQQEQFDTSQKNAAPWITAGQGTVSQLSNLLQPGGYLSQGFNEPFQAPTDITEQNDPGYQFRLQQGQQALERSAAARGNLLTGGTAKALDRYSQDYASNEYNNVYNRALTEYQQRYNIFNNNQTNLYNRLAGVSGLGQSSTSNLASTGLGTANAMSNILTSTAQGMGAAYQNAGAARASGYVGGANAINSGISGATSSLNNLLLMNAISGGGSAGPSISANDIPGSTAYPGLAGAFAFQG